MESSRPEIEAREPQWFSSKAVFILNCFPILLLIPVLLVLTVLALVRIEPSNAIPMILVLQLALAMTVYFLPFGLGNPYVTHLVRRFAPATPTKRRQFIVQVTLHPRLRTGLRAFADDADDVGVLQFDEADMVIKGDSLQIRLPLNQIGGVGLKNIGWRGFWLAGQRVTINVPGIPGIRSLEIVERSAWTIRKSRRITHELYELLEFHRQRCGSP